MSFRASSFLTARRGLVLGLVLAAAALAPARAQQPATVTTFAAASLTNALEDISKAYAAKGGKAEVRFSFAASSVLAKQLEAGAPASIFASADLKWMDYAESKSLVLPESRVTLLGNALVLVAPADKAAPVAISKDMDIAALLGPNGRIATGLVDS